MITYSIFTILRLKIRLKPAVHVCCKEFKNIYETEGIRTPIILGIIKPRIYLPAGLTENERSYIIRHELNHIKRFDHIIKPFAYFVLCIHWFNPLVWIAFSLMSEDMEMSCDESVIREMGSGIKKSYSSSLLYLSAGRRKVAGCPLAFGENSTKKRIINVLNYKKPGLWVVVAALIAVVAIIIGLMSDPPQKQPTVHDFAEQFIKQEIKTYESYNTTDSKITKLEKIAEHDNLLSTPVEIWRIEYRLKPTENTDSIAGGMNMENGWLTEDSSMGKPYLIFTIDNSKPRYLGCIRDGEGIDLSSLAGQEIALREFLEGKKLLPPETFSGNHVLVKFPASTGETCQLLLSQPVLQGDEGIWCVERWMDGTGNIYYNIPKTNVSIADYYKELQKQADEGSMAYLKDPLEVALRYINNESGTRKYAVLDELEPKYSATTEDFLETPVSKYIGYISNFEMSGFSKPAFHLERVEWLTSADEKRLKELGIDPGELPNGYYIHNPDTYPMFFQVTDKTTYTIVTPGEQAGQKKVALDEFVRYLEEHEKNKPLFWITTKNGYVTSITEQYRP